MQLLIEVDAPPSTRLDPLMSYSYLSATIGSTRIARRAGT
jgi:hypothetical protein